MERSLRPIALTTIVLVMVYAGVLITSWVGISGSPSVTAYGLLTLLSLAAILVIVVAPPVITIVALIAGVDTVRGWRGLNPRQRWLGMVAIGMAILFWVYQLSPLGQAVMGWFLNFD
jgi:hypothetical protein